MIIYSMRHLIVYVFCLPVFLLSAQAQLNQIDHWEMLVEAAETWRYFPGTEEPPQEWRYVFFNDGSWSQGPGGIGYGDGDDATVIEPVGSLYMR